MDYLLTFKKNLRMYAKENTFKSWYLTLGSFFLFGITFLAGVYPSHYAIQTVSALLAGFMCIRVFILYHDYIHQAILKESFFAKWLFTLYGLYVLAPTSTWKHSHNYHHKHNSKLGQPSIGSFPILTKQEFLSATKNEKRRYLFARHPVTIALGYLFAFMLSITLKSFIKNPSKHIDSLLSLILHFSIGAFIYIFLGPFSFFIGFLMPNFIAMGIGTYLFYAQHSYPSVKFATSDEWDHAGAALNSSSYMKMNALLKWITGNIGYHHIHHLDSLIPFYNLPKVYRSFPEFQRTKDTSLSLKDIRACLRLKVWCPKDNRMLTLKEIKLDAS